MDGFYKFLWWCPQVDNEFKEYKNKVQGHEI